MEERLSMKKSLLAICLIVLLFPIVSIMIGVNVQGQVDHEIKVAINAGTFGWAYYENVKEVLDGYSWVVNDTEYNFTTFKIDINDVLNDKLWEDGYSVHIIDGLVEELLKCIRIPIYGEDDRIRENLNDAIYDHGVGYIGRCAGAMLAPTYYERQPETLYQYFLIKQNAFLEKKPEIKMYWNLGLPIASRYLKMYYPPFIPVPGPRKHVDHKALGTTAYGCYSCDSKKAINYDFNFNGICHNLTNLDKTHAILKDYHGETLYTVDGSGVFPNPPCYASVIGRYPAGWEDNPKQHLSVWEFKPIDAIRYELKQLLSNPLYYLFGKIGEFIDNPFNFTNEYFMDWPCWHKTDEKVEADMSYQPAIIAFPHGNGRVVLSSPHVGAKIRPDDIFINETEYTGQGINTSYGLYHWEFENGTWVNRSKHFKPNTDLYWYQRREAAWVAKEKIPNDHLPPIYNRSHVVDFDAKLQNSIEFPINCTVGKNSTAEWNWNSDDKFTVNLTLYYKWKNSSSKPDDPWPEKWTAYDSIYGRPYNFTFNASVNGSGYYCFCSVLNTTNLSSGIWTNDSFPPEPDAKTEYNTSIAADFEKEVNYAYATKSIPFNSSKSITLDSNITSYQWQFGDGEESNESNPTHTFDDDGEYNVTLTVQNAKSCSASVTKKIVVHNNRPMVDFDPGYKVVFVNETVNFTDNSSDIDGNLSHWHWDFGDDTNSMVQNTSHSYPMSGFYRVSLEVADDDKATNSTSGFILVIDSLVNQSITPQGNKYNNIQDAVDNSSTTNFIYVENGAYSENIFINKSISLVGEDRNNVVIHGSVTMNNPYDYELPNNKSIDIFIFANMTGNELLLHFNNDSTVGENYSASNLVFDYSGQGNNGTNNGAIWATSTLKGAGTFDFNGNSSINLSSLPALVGENVTVSAWVFWTNGSGSRDPIISQSNATQGYCLYVNSSNAKPVFRLDSVEVISSTNLSSNEWHYIVGSHNQTKLKIYVDGRLQGTTNKTGSGFDTQGFIAYDNVSQYYSSKIDEVAVWNRTLTMDEIGLIYESNNGLYIGGVTIRDSDVGVTVCNHSELFYCYLINHTISVLLNNSNNIHINMCNITDVDTGIKINCSNPDSFYSNQVVDCTIDNATSAIVVNNSSYLYIVRTMVNGSSSNLSFSGCDFDSIYVIDCDSPGNVAPDLPSISGPTLGEINTSYTFSTVTNDSNGDQILYWFDWGDGNFSGWLSLYGSNETVNVTHTWMEQGNYQVRVKAKDVFNNETSWNESLFIIDTLPPLINSVNDTLEDAAPYAVGLGGNVTITADVIDDPGGGCSGVQTVKVNISSPDDNTMGNFTMNFVGDDSYEYVFSDIWLVGKYNYSIWACDNASNSNCSSVYSFNVSAQADVSVCTIKDEYGVNETVNLTDPPGPPSQQIGYELLDDNKVLRIWNKFDSYYFNTSNGVQFTNHKDEYWSHNVLMLGYYNNDMWNLIYRNDELSGFNKNVTSDDETYVNATLWKDLSYGGYDFRLAVRYHLGVDDNELTIIPFIKNIDDEDIPYILGFAWEINDIQVDMTPENDYIEIDDTWYYLNGEIDETYTDLAQACYYIREDKTENTSESLYLKWDEDLNYKVKVESRDGQYNAPVTLGIRIGTLDIGQEKYTSLFWHDASEVTYYFNSYDTGEAWSTNPGYMVDGNIGNYALASGMDFNCVELCDGNTCSKKVNLGNISKVELRAYGYYSGSQRDIILRPIFGGTEDGDNYTFVTTTTPSWSSWFDITNDTSDLEDLEEWSWYDIKDLMCDVEAEDDFGIWNLYCSKVEMRVTYTPHPSEISDPYPADGSTGIGIAPLLNITVSDPQGDNMNISWLSNSSGSWVAFGTNSSVGNGTYHQTFVNASVNGMWWYWKVNVSDGTSYTVSDVFRFYTGNQSMIENTGSKAIKGYLLMQVQFYNTSLEEWVVANDTVNETSLRTINSSEQLALDTIFNGLVNTSDLLSVFGSGTYRVYACFRDPDGNVLVCNDQSLMEATYEFTVSSS